jgi:hypothetical protein
MTSTTCNKRRRKTTSTTGRGKSKRKKGSGDTVDPLTGLTEDETEVIDELQRVQALRDGYEDNLDFGASMAARALDDMGALMVWPFVKARNITVIEAAARVYPKALTAALRDIDFELPIE